MLEKDQTETFDVLVNISENSLSFTKVSKDADNHRVLNVMS